MHVDYSKPIIIRYIIIMKTKSFILGFTVQPTGTMK